LLINSIGGVVNRHGLRSTGAFVKPSAASKVVLLVGDPREWPPELESFVAGQGYATDRLAELDAVVPRLEQAENGPVRALLVVARPLGASDLLILRRVRESSPATAIVAVTTTPTSPTSGALRERGNRLPWPSKEALRQAVESGRGLR
jgi:hypothetical protein